ncbi:tetraspanin-1 [Lissotriton helveticus]
MSCFTFIKVLMILFNLIIFLGGGTLLGVGIWVTVDSKSFLNIFGAFASDLNQFVNVGYFLIAIGAVLVVLGFLGCCGAQKESKCLLITFFTLILLIFIAEVAGAVVAFVYSSMAQNIMEPLLRQVLQKDYGREPSTTQVWNSTMTELKCCGFSNYTDFNASYYLQHYSNSYPPQCCNSTVTTCTFELAAASKTQGCFEELLSTIKKNAAVVGGVAAGIAALEIAAMVVAMYLYCHIDNKA